MEDQLLVHCFPLAHGLQLLLPLLLTANTIIQLSWEMDNTSLAKDFLVGFNALLEHSVSNSFVIFLHESIYAN